MRASLLLLLLVAAAASASLIWRVHHAVPDFPYGILPGASRRANRRLTRAPGLSCEMKCCVAAGYVDMYARGQGKTASIVVGLGFGGTTSPVYLTLVTDHAWLLPL
jgi:hypothetical protein